MIGTGTTGARRSGGAEARGGALWGLAGGDVAAGGRETGPALAVWDAAVDGVGDLEAFASRVLDHLLSWHADQPRSDAHPSLAALRRNGDPASWPRLAVPERAGVSVARAAWLGVHPAVGVGELAVAARVQALVTDAHPVTPVAAEVAAMLTRALARGEAVPGRVAPWLRCYLAEARTAPPDPVLARVAEAGAGRHLHAGWAALDALLLGAGDTTDDPPPDGADGALAIAVRLLDAGDDVTTAIDRAALRGRGSASAACLTGAFLGAAHGPVLGTDWVPRLDGADREALTLRECGDAPRRFTTVWREPVGAPPT